VKSDGRYQLGRRVLEQTRVKKREDAFGECCVQCCVVWDVRVIRCLSVTAFKCKYCKISFDYRNGCVKVK